MTSCPSLRPRPGRAWVCLYGVLLVLGAARLLGAAELDADHRTDFSSADLAVVVHPRTPVDDLSLEALRRIFLGEQQFWPDKTRVTVLLHPPGSPAREVTLRVIYQMSEAEFRRYWVAKMFRAEVTTGPKALPRSANALELVAAIPGAISLVPAAATGPTSQVKVLRINGRLAGEPGYPLPGAVR